MKGQDFITAFVAMFLLVGIVLANDQEVDEEKDIEVRNARTTSCFRFQLNINTSVANVMGGAAMALSF